jgi:hypothetical protein
VIDLLRESTWLYPLVQMLHILGFVVLAGAAILFDLRVLGLSSTRAGAGGQVPIRALGLHLLPWSVLAALLVVPTGVLMFLVDAPALIGNRAFVLKLCLLAVAAGNAIAFHQGVGRGWAGWTDDSRVPAAARLHAAGSIGVWIAVIGCGRWIAYA